MMPEIQQTDESENADEVNESGEGNAANAGNDSQGYQSIVFCELNGLHFGILLDYVVQALPYPSSLQIFPRRDHAILGVFEFRDLTLPLIDLRRWLPWPGEHCEASEQVLILCKQGRSISIAIDAVHGLQKIKCSQIDQIIHRSGEQELFQQTIRISSKLRISNEQSAQSVQADQPDQIFGLLDVAALLELSLCWAETEQLTSNLTFQNHQVQTDQQIESVQKAAIIPPFAIFGLENRKIAISAMHVAAVVAMPKIQKILGTHADWLGMCKWRERDVAVLSTLESIGLKSSDAATSNEKLLLIVMHNGLCLGLPVDQVHAIEHLNTAQIQSPEAAGYAANTVLTGILNLADQPSIFIFDAVALIETCPMSSLSLLEESVKKESKLSNEAYVVIQSGQTWALGMHYLDAIIEVPDQIDENASNHSAHIGSFNWKNQIVPLWDLKALKSKGHTEKSLSNRILLIKNEQALDAFLIEDLMLLLPARSGQILEFSTHGSDSSQIILLEQDNYVKSYSILDLTDWKPLPSAILV